MRIIKYGHSCLLVEDNGTRLLTDPGGWSDIPSLENIDGIVITHEHGDHCDIAKLKTILAANPDCHIVTHAAVGALLAAENLPCETIEPGQTITVKNMTVESYGTEHAVIHGASPCRNTGYLINEKLFAPGDALHDIPTKPIGLLALPTGGPWMKLGEAIDYAKALKPRIVFPIHDAMYTNVYRDSVIINWLTKTLTPEGIEYRNLVAGESLDA